MGKKKRLLSEHMNLGPQESETKLRSKLHLKLKKPNIYMALVFRVSLMCQINGIATQQNRYSYNFTGKDA